MREGILHDLAAAHFGPATAHDERAEALRQQARRFAGRMHSDAAHCEQVRRLAAQLFDQLATIHGLPPGQRVPLELGALLHDVGLAVNASAHHKHGEYLVRNADIPGLSGHQQAVVACLVRYHGKATPETAPPRCIARWDRRNASGCGNWRAAAHRRRRWMPTGTQASTARGSAHSAQDRLAARDRAAEEYT